MKKILIAIFILALVNSFPAYLKAQSLYQNDKHLFSLNSPSENLTGLRLASVLFPFNPILQVEDGKLNFGFTKELTLGIVKAGHIAIEYSHIFKENDKEQLRFSYNYDFFTKPGDFAVFYYSIGAGYFTDFNRKGFFPQASLNVIFPIDDFVGVVPYVKLRNTFMTEKEKPNIFDFSLGLKTSFYF